MQETHTNKKVLYDVINPHSYSSRPPLWGNCGKLIPPEFKFWYCLFKQNLRYLRHLGIFFYSSQHSESESCSVMSDSLWPHGLYSSWNSSGQNTGVGSHSLLQGIFPIQGSNPGLPRCRRILYQLIHKGSLRILEWVAYPFSSRSSQSRNRIGVSCIAGRFFTKWAIREAIYEIVGP